MTTSPDPQHYDLVIIGSGSGNSMINDELDHWRIAMVDDGLRYGGTCLNVGCIPTKMFVLPADLADGPRDAARLGVDLALRGVDFPAVRDRIFRRIDPISEGGLDWRERQEHVDVYRETGRFVDPHTLELSSGRRISGDRIVIAAGSRPRPLSVPAAPSVAELVHTSDSIMRIDELPKRLLILGAGFVSVEFAHVFSAYGVDVTVIHRGHTLLKHEDHEVSERYRQLVAEKVTLALGEHVVRLEEAPEGGVRVVTMVEGEERHHEGDLVLNAIGRLPNGDRLDVVAAGLGLDAQGFIPVNEYQRTAVDHIWALGDVCSPAMLKHVANREMRVVRHNLLHPEDLRATDHRFIPHAVFGHPQIASVGATQQDLDAAGRPYLVKVQNYGDVAYGWAMEDTEHFVKLISDPLTDKLLGAHIIGPQASTLIQQLIQMMVFDQGVSSVAHSQYWIHPALPEVIENALLALEESRRQWLEEHQA